MTSRPQEPEWLKYLDNDLRDKPLVPTEALTNALQNMPAEHPQRPFLEKTLERILRQRDKKDPSVRMMQAGMKLRLGGLEAIARDVCEGAGGDGGVDACDGLGAKLAVDGGLRLPLPQRLEGATQHAMQRALGT